MLTTTMFPFIALALFKASAVAFCGHGTSLDTLTSIESYGTFSQSASDWGYDGFSDGPVNWFSHSRNWNKDCSFLPVQSPRNFPDFVRATASPYVMNIPTAALKVKHLNLTVEIFQEHHVPFGNLIFSGEVYDLKQFHFHTPSEHRIHSEYSPVEVHFVHESQSNKGKLAVVAMLFEVRAETKEEPWKSLLAAENLNHKIPLVGEETNTPVLDFQSVMKNILGDVYHYQGSLTTPPCSDGVQFILSASKIELSWMHYNNLKALVKFNSRPVQNDLGFENALLVAAEDISNASSSSDATSKRLMANRNHEVLVDQQEPLKEHPLEHNLL